MRFIVWGSGFGFLGSGFGVRGFGSRVSGFRIQVQGSGFGVRGLGFGIPPTARPAATGAVSRRQTERGHAPIIGLVMARVRKQNPVISNQFFDNFMDQF